MRNRVFLIKIKISMIYRFKLKESGLKLFSNSSEIFFRVTDFKSGRAVDSLKFIYQLNTFISI